MVDINDVDSRKKINPGRKLAVLFWYDKHFRSTITVVFLFVLSLALIALKNSSSTGKKIAGNAPTTAGLRISGNKAVAVVDMCPAPGCVHFSLNMESIEFEEQIENLASKNGEVSINFASVTLTSNRESNTNQDRAFIVSPFQPTPETKPGHENNFIVGIFDGHMDLGHLVAEHARNSFAPFLAKRLDLNSHKPLTRELMHNLLKQTFLEVDRSIPRHLASLGGCTASVGVRLGNVVYIANAGDSRTMIMAHDKSNQNPSMKDFLIYANRVDKPHLPEERTRIESKGGKVDIPTPPDPPEWSRVIYFSTAKNENISLGMSRSMGDGESTMVGVTPEPIVESFSISELRENARQILIESLEQEDNLSPKQKENLYHLQQPTQPSSQNLHEPDENQRGKTEVLTEQLEFYIVSASDGLTDARRPAFMAKHFGESLYSNINPKHPIVACKELIELAMPPSYDPPLYRDDITMSFIKIID